MSPRRSAGAHRLEDLRSRGFKVEVRHIRHLESDGEVSLFGGETDVVIYNQEDRVLATGRAACRPDERFDRKLGLTIAIGRAYREFEDNVPF